MTIQQIKEDLLNVRMFYYEKEFYLRWVRRGFKTNLIKLVEKYDKAMEYAPAHLLRVYIGIYCESKTFAELEDEIGRCGRVIREWKNELFEYLRETLTNIS